MEQFYLVCFSINIIPQLCIKLLSYGKKKNLLRFSRAFVILLI